MVRSEWIIRLGRAAVVCVLIVAAWALARDNPSPSPSAEPDEGAAPPANHAPVLTFSHTGEEIPVRAGERVTVIVEALDPDIAENEAFETVWLSAGVVVAPDKALPAWLGEPVRSAGPSDRPRLHLAFAPPLDAKPGRYVVEAGATDTRGLTTLGSITVSVLAPLCGSAEFNEGGECRSCPDHHLANESGLGCMPCPAGTERPTGSTACVACSPGLVSEAGAACGCGPARVLANGVCVDCPPHTESDGGACVACPAGTERPSGAELCADCSPRETSPGGTACAAEDRIAKHTTAGLTTKSAAPVTTGTTTSQTTIVASLVNAESTKLAEDVGRVNVRLHLDPEPTQGTYTGCRLRLGAGSEAASPSDVTFSNQKKLTPSNGWSARAGLLTVVDDALDEGDETLVVEGHCTSSKNQADPPHADLVSRPLTLTILDNDSATPLQLSVDPDTLGESLGRQEVTVTAALDDPASAAADIALDLGAGSYTVTGTQSIQIPTGAASGSTKLHFTPTDDANTTDDTVAIGGTASGYAITGTSFTIREPVIVDGVDVSGLGIAVSVSPTAIREGTQGLHRIAATLTGVPVPGVDVALVLALGGTATQGSSHDFTLRGADGWEKLTVPANDAHLTASTSVRVNALTDTVEEGEETVLFLVSRVTWGTTVVTLAEPAMATLRITEAWETPEAPSGLAVTPAAGDERHGLDVGWEAVTATPPVDAHVVRYRAVADPPAQWRETEPQPGVSTSITGLSAGTRYEVRVRADNAAGDGAESGSVYAHTADGNCTVGAPRVTTPRGARSATELEVSWEAAACVPATTIQHYLVRYREDPEMEAVTNDWFGETSKVLTATLVSLTPDTAYVVEVRAVATGGDNGPWSAAGKGRTGLDTRRPPRVGAPVVEANATSGASQLDATWMRVAWTDKDNVAHPIAEYQYRSRKTGGAWTEPTDAQATPAETSSLTRTLAGLETGTRYEVQVRGVNRMAGVAYPGKWSEPGMGRTWGVPDRVEEPAAYGTSSAVEVIWDAPHDGGSPITDYDVAYKTNDSSGWETHPYDGCGMASCATETSIAAAAKKVRVRAENALGLGEWSPTARVRELKLLRVSFAQSSAAVTEGESLNVTVRLNSAADRAVTIPLTTTGGAGKFRLDGAANNTVVFGLGALRQRFTLVALDDADNADEAVTLGLGQLPDGVLRTTPSTLAVAIEDDEPQNGPPTFNDGSTATRAVPENSAAATAVGAPVAATDPDDDALTYTLSGADAALFTIDANTGQIRVGTNTPLDFEGTVTSYALAVEVGDGKDGTGQPDTAIDAVVAVTINVTDVAEPPSAPDAPTLGEGARSLSVSWTAPGTTGPTITGYDLGYRIVGAGDWTVAPHDGVDTLTNIRSLTPGAVHEVRVRAKNDEGVGLWSAAATAATVPWVRVEAGERRPRIGADNASAEVTLTATIEFADGELVGRWRRSNLKGTVQFLSEPLTLKSGEPETFTASLATPGQWSYSLKATHSLNGRTRVQHQGDLIEWLPGVVLGVEPDRVSEHGGPRTLTVTATLTGAGVTEKEKTVTVSFVGGTATEGDDFGAVDDVSITIPPNARSASTTFELTPVADSIDDNAETVSVTGTALQPGDTLRVFGTAVTLDEADPVLTVTPPTKGRIAGVDANRSTVIDCGPGGGTDCSVSAPTGTTITLTATANANHVFGGWTGDCSGTAACAVTLNADKTVGATFVALPGRPGQPTATPTNHETLKIAWRAPSGTGTGIEEYKLRHRKTGASAWTEAATGSAGTTATLGRLAAGTRYDIQVRAVAAEGPGLWSNTIEAVTLPSVSVQVDNTRPVIGDGDAEASATLTAAARAADGKLTGRWVRRVNGAFETVNGDSFVMTGGAEYKATFESDTPGARTYGLRVSHAPNQSAGEVGETVDIRWLPSVVLGADPASVAEDGGAQIVTVTARLTGKNVENVAKRVTVRVTGGTATAGTDFAAVDDFNIALTAGKRSATGTFELAPVADGDREGAETVAVNGSAAQNAIALPVLGSAVTINDVVRHTLTVTKPANGKITGTVGTEKVIDCGADCTETAIDGTTVALTAEGDQGYGLDAWGGACASETSANCSVTLDADRAVSVAFALGPTVGRCNPSVVDGCESGTLNATRYEDTDSHHQWRCDGANGGADSSKCAKEKEPCTASPRSWSAGGHTCSGAVTAAASGQTRPALDNGDPTRGSAAYKCDDAVWLEQPGSTCTVNLQCGATENICLPADVVWQDKTDTSATAGACARTEASRCLNNTKYKDERDITLEHGDCGNTTNRCDGGTNVNLPDTAEKNRWKCEGRDARDRWSCLGIDGAKNWSCSYGSQSKMCSVPVNATDRSCSRTTATATDATDCFTCKSNYERCDNGCHSPCADGKVRNTTTCGCDALDLCGDVEANCKSSATSQNTKDTLMPLIDKWTCSLSGVTQYCTADPPACGDHEEYALNEENELTCVCSDGYHRHNRSCHENPMCSDPLVKDTCEVGTPMDSMDTAVYGACEATKDEGCTKPDGGMFQSDANTPASNGKCGAALNTCESGMVNPASKKKTIEKDSWDCLGTDGSKNWTCKGTSGEQTWACQNGDPRKSPTCQISVTDTDKACRELISATHDSGCYVCNEGYEDYNGNCVAKCGDNEERNTNGQCVCKSGYGKLNGACVRQYILTVMVVPAETGKITGEGLNCTSTCTTTVFENKEVTLTTSGNTGYYCSPIERFRMTSDLTKPTNCNHTLEALPVGPYTANYVQIVLPFGGVSTFYTTQVSASATGGVKPYTYLWSDNAVSPKAAATAYIWPKRAEVPADVTVTVSDKLVATKAPGARTSSAEATINLPSASAAQSGSTDSFAFEVPLGGELNFVWGGKGTVTARSEDATVASVAVSSAVIRVTGMAIGETYVGVRTEEGEWWLPVKVR